MMYGGKGKCTGSKIAWALVIIGALNWGLVGVAKFNLVMAILGSVPVVERIVYVLVGVAGIMVLVGCRCKLCKSCCCCGKADCPTCGGKKMDSMNTMGDMKKM